MKADMVNAERYESELMTMEKKKVQFALDNAEDDNFGVMCFETMV